MLINLKWIRYTRQSILEWCVCVCVRIRIRFIEFISVEYKFKRFYGGVDDVVVYFYFCFVAISVTVCVLACMDMYVLSSPVHTIELLIIIIECWRCIHLSLRKICFPSIQDQYSHYVYHFVTLLYATQPDTDDHEILILVHRIHWVIEENIRKLRTVFH